MKLNIIKNGFRNIWYGFINKFVTILFPFILRTVLIHVLGTEYLGLSSLFTSILQVLSLAELGMGSAMVFELYNPIAKNDYEKIRNLQKVYRLIYKIIGIVILILGMILLPFLRFFINGNIPNEINIYVLYLLYLLNASVSYLLFSYKMTILSAYQRRDIISNISTITHLMLYIVQIICLFKFHNYYLYVIWLPIFTIIENAISAIYVNKNYKDLSASGKINKNEIKKILNDVKNLFGHKLSNVVTNSVDTIVISSFLGLTMVTIYNNYYYLMSAIIGVLDIIYQGFLAGIGNSIANDNIDKNKDVFYKVLFANSWLVGWCSICFLCLYQPMMRIWMGEDLMLPFLSIVLFVIYFYVLKSRQVVLLYKDAAGLWKIDNKKPYVEIITNIIINIVLVNLIGINGILISTIISIAFVSIPWETITFFKSYFKENVKQYFKDYLKYTCVFIFLAIITYLICYFVKLNYNNYLELLIKSIICIIVPNTIYILIYYKDSKMKYFFNILKGKFIN